MTTDRGQPMTAWDSVFRTLLAECGLRPVWLHEILELVARYSSTESYDEIRPLTVKMVSQLLQRQGVKVWSVHRLPASAQATVQWDDSLKCVLDRIDHAWAALGREPGFEEIAFLRRLDLAQGLTTDVEGGPA